MLRPVGSPLALGFVALTAATFVVSGLQLGWVEPGEGRNVALILIGFVVSLQLVTSVFGFLARDSLAGTAMGILSGAWLAVGLVGLLLAVLAMYAAWAFELEDPFGHRWSVATHVEDVSPEEMGRRAAGLADGG